MKYFWFFASIMLLCTVNLAFAVQENTLSNTKSDFPESIKVEEKTPFSLKLSNLGEIRISNIEPIITIMPKSASEFVHVEINPQISTLWEGFYQNTNGTIHVDKEIPVDKIFVSVSFVGKNSYGKQVPLSSDSTFNASIKIEKSQNKEILNDFITVQGNEKQGTDYVKYDFSKEERVILPAFTKKNPLPSKIIQSMQDWCADSPISSKKDPMFWDAVPIRILSISSEFQSLNGKTDSFVINSNAGDASCPPNVEMSGTFASEDGKRYGFALEYDSNSFRYHIEKTGIENVKAIPTPRQQMKMGIPLYEIKCKEGFYPTFKIDRVTPACVTEATMDKLLIRGWSPLRLGMPAETNILITYGAIQIFPHNVTQKLDPRSPYSNMIFWVNNDIMPHTIMAKDGTWSTGVIESGEMGSMIFNQTGVYDYFIKEKPSTTGFVEFSGMVEIED